jgi:hypothetical protein
MIIAPFFILIALGLMLFVRRGEAIQTVVANRDLDSRPVIE